MKLSHNHGSNWGIPVAGCPRCEQLREFPYVLTYKLDCHKVIQRVPVRNVRHAEEVIKAQLPAVPLRVPIVATPSGETVAILRFT